MNGYDLCLNNDSMDNLTENIVPVSGDIDGQQSQRKYKPIDDDNEKEHTRLVTWKGVVMYGICVILSTHFGNWTVMLKAGFWETFAAIVIVCSASGCMMLCIAEMTAALPFSGGTYGIVRVTLGDFTGYLVGTGEILLYVCIVVFKMSSLGKMITIMTKYDEKYEPLYWAIIYITFGVITMNHRLLFWRSVWVFGVYICVILLLYCTMTRTGDVDFAKYTKDPMVESESYNDHLYSFFEQLPVGNLFFNLYLKVSPLTCRECKNPTTDVPLAMYIVYALAIMSAFSVLFCMSSIFPGVTVLRRSPGAPLSFGISSMFDITMEHAMAFTFLAKYTTCFVLVFAFTQQMAALSKSGFLWNSRKWGFVSDTVDRLVGLLVGCGIGYILNIMIFYWNVDIHLYVTYGAKMFNSTINVVVFVTYIVFRQQFPSLMKKFRSPLGVAGAVYGLLVYIMLWACVGALNSMGDHWRPFLLLAGFLVLWSLPFVLYYRHHIIFSEEESSVLFVAYVMKANQVRRLRRQNSPRNSTRSYHNHKGKTSIRSARPRTANNNSVGVELSVDPATHVGDRKEEGKGERGDENNLEEGRAAPQTSISTQQPAGDFPLHLDPPDSNPPTSHMPSGSSNMSIVGGRRVLPIESFNEREIQGETRTGTQGRAFPVLYQIAVEDSAQQTGPVEQNSQHTSAVVQVLARQLGYDEEVIRQVATELQEYYGADCSDRGNDSGQNVH